MLLPYSSFSPSSSSLPLVYKGKGHPEANGIDEYDFWPLPDKVSNNSHILSYQQTIVATTTTDTHN